MLHRMRWQRVVFAALLVGGVALRLNGIAGSIWLDESISLLQAQSSISETVKMVSEDVHTPLYPVLLNLWTTIFGESVVSARLLSIVFYIGSTVILYKLCTRFLDAETGL